MYGSAWLLVSIIRKALLFYELLIILNVVFSWLQISPYRRGIGPVVGFVRVATEPLLTPLRDALHRLLGRLPYGLDFSPFVLIMLLEVVRAMLERLLLG
jgi:uncharacterized protein YggT (Ycf19 family)